MRSLDRVLPLPQHSFIQLPPSITSLEINANHGSTKVVASRKSLPYFRAALLVCFPATALFAFLSARQKNTNITSNRARNLAIASAVSLLGGYAMIKTRSLAEKRKQRADGDYSVSVDRSVSLPTCALMLLIFQLLSRITLNGSLDSH